MARYFREEDIDEFRECFYLFARSGQIRTLDELTIIMRSLGLSPTIAELNKYMKDKGGKMSFADFLEVMHFQTRAEDLPKEVIKAFQAADTSHSGTIPARQLAHMLLHWGEQLSSKEVCRRLLTEGTAPFRSRMRIYALHLPTPLISMQGRIKLKT
ncbi:calmodulin isoform X3 [Solenopsis invicta]|uniref:calmodulin isoform X3 n=1 Tax=Solenopsis invicta TaxID=13686 RepID=UPI00193EBC4E|nr:calmodulin isoform X3 [Solenopsis invicta]